MCEMTYRSVHKAKGSYELTVLWLLIGAFVLAMALMFVHPTASLLVFFMGFAFLGVAVLIDKLFASVEQAAARTALKSHTCPSCGANVDRDRQQDDEWHCLACGAAFLDTGAEQTPSTQTQ